MTITVDNRKSIIPVNKTISINDSDNKRDHYLTSWDESSNAKENELSSVPVILIPSCIKNNPFSIELLKNNDSFVQTNNHPNDKDVDITPETLNNHAVIPVVKQNHPKDKDVNIPSENKSSKTYKENDNQVSSDKFKKKKSIYFRKIQMFLKIKMLI